jgi:hypothetical protein
LCVAANILNLRNHAGYSEWTTTQSAKCPWFTKLGPFNPESVRDSPNWARSEQTTTQARTFKIRPTGPLKPETFTIYQTEATRSGRQPKAEVQDSPNWYLLFTKEETKPWFQGTSLWFSGNQAWFAGNRCLISVKFQDKVPDSQAIGWKWISFTP